MARSMVGVFVCLVFALSSSFSQAKSDRKILVIGDSISNGHGLATPWPTLLKRETGINIVNRSVSAVETDFGVTEIANGLTQHNPSDVIIMMGTNDVARDKSLNSALANLQSMINQARDANARVFIATILPILGSEFSRFNQRSLDLNAGIADLNGAFLVDVRAAFVDPTSLMADNLHPNQLGQNVIFNVFLPEILKTASSDTVFLPAIDLLLATD
ncbi:MAG: GDSL-type esterase/lipase family protein [Gammaproteobacteria bacterium]|nr:GDSL-type esterase/lipase family protein [Gammaproteobacteria bacterium]